MQTLGAFEAKTHLSSLLDRVAKGESFTITKHGMPVARLMPVAEHAPQRVAAAIDRMETLSSSLTLDGDWKELRDAGRKW